MTVSRLAFAVVVGLAVAAPAMAREGSSRGFPGVTATADAAALARIRDARPIGARAEAAETNDRDQTAARSDKVLEALKPVFGKKK